MNQVIYVISNIGMIILCLFIYRIGLLDGQKISKGELKEFSPTLKKNKEPIQKVSNDKYWDNIMAYDGNPQKDDEKEVKANGI